MRLTLDAEIQDRTEEILEQVGREFSPKGASAIVMDPNDGAVLAMANWPRIDSNDLSKTPAWALQNRAVGFAHEPGSTFKAFTVAGALAGRRRRRPTRSSTCRRRSRSPTA